MLAYLLLGVALLLGVYVLVRLFAGANPATLAQIFKWSVVVIAGLFAAILLLRGQTLLGGLFGALAAMAWRNARIPAWGRARAFGGGRSGDASRVETHWLAMSLDHDSGEVDGEVLKGRFAGRKLSALAVDELFDLLEAVAGDDPRSVPLIEAYLDRVHGDWRPQYDERTAAGGHSPGGAPADGFRGMSRQEALEILGLGKHPSESEIKEAHREMILKYHPDHGGSDYFAAKINRAKEILLGERRATG